MKTLFRIVPILALMVIVGCKTKNILPTGVYSNEASGFGHSNVFLSPSGYGVVVLGVAGAGGTWEVFDEDRNTFVHFRLADIYSFSYRIIEHSALFVYDQTNKSLHLVALSDSLEIAKEEYRNRPKHFKIDREKNFSFVTNQIPQQINAFIVKFPAELERAKFRIKYHAEQKAAEEARIRAEQPQYEACLKKITENPQYVLSIQFKFYQKGDSDDFLIGRIKSSPESRAVVDAFKNKDIVFSDNVLMQFLERFEWSRYFNIIRPIFSRDELSEESRRKLHPRMKEFSRNISMDIAREFYEHKNTPIDLLREAHEWKIISSNYLKEREETQKKDANNCSIPTEL